MTQKGLSIYARILVPVDGSATSLRGPDEAIALAGRLGARLRLLDVLEESAIALASGGFAGNVGELFNLLREGGQAILEAAKQRAGARGVPADTVMHESLSGRVSDVVIKAAAGWGAELNIIGTHGRRGAARALIGSDPEQIVRLAPTSVLLVRDTGKPA